MRWLDELISELQKIRAEHGNLPLAYVDDRAESMELPIKVTIVKISECWEPKDGFDPAPHEKAVIVDA